MKKLIMMALPLAVSCGLASAATYQPCSNNGDTWTLALLQTIAGGATAAGCEVGDKIFTNFSSSTLPNAGDFFTFFQQLPLSANQYIMELSPSGTGGETTFGTGFNYSFTVMIDPNVAQPGGKVASFSTLTAGIVDSNQGSTALLTKNTVPNSGAPCTVQFTDNGAGNLSGGNVCSYPVGATSMNVTETYAYTGGGNTSGVTQLQNTITQQLTSTQTTPEPMSLLLFGSGLLGLGFIGRKRMARK